MRLPTLLVAVSLLAIAGVGHTQQPIVVPPSPGIPPIEPPVPAVPPKAEQTLDQMLDALEALRVQKAELEKKEHAMVEAINKKLDTQTERMKKLGIKKPTQIDEPMLPPIVSSTFPALVPPMLGSALPPVIPPPPVIK